MDKFSNYIKNDNIILIYVKELIDYKKLNFYLNYLNFKFIYNSDSLNENNDSFLVFDTSNESDFNNKILYYNLNNKIIFINFNKNNSLKLTYASSKILTFIDEKFYCVKNRYGSCKYILDISNDLLLFKRKEKLKNII